MPNLSHQHSKVRLATLSGLKHLVLSGLPAGLMNSQVAPAIKPLTFDHTASVREAYYQALASWLGCSMQQQQQGGATSSSDAAAAAAADAHAKCRTYAPVLLPLLLLGISDPQPNIAAASLQSVEQAGLAWQLQQSDPNAATSTAATAAATAAIGASSDAAVPMDTDPPGAAAAALTNSSSAQSSHSLSEDSLQVLAAAEAAAQLPPPYQGLPTLPCRLMVSSLLPQLLPLVLSGLREWTVTLRSAAARLLHTSLVLSGPAVTPYLAQLLPGLISAMSDDDADIVTMLASSCRLLGAFVPSSAWLPLLVDAAADPKTGPASKANTLVVLSCLTHAAAAAQQAAEPQLLQVLVKTLASDEVLGCDHAGLQTQLLIVVQNLLAWMQPADVAEARQQLYLILLQLHGVAAAAGSSNAAADASAGPPAASGTPGDSSQAGRVLAVLQQLAECTGLAGGVTQLAQAHAQQLLPLLIADVSKWGSGSHNLLTFTSLMQTAGAECLSELLPQIAQVRDSDCLPCHVASQGPVHVHVH